MLGIVAVPLTIVGISLLFTDPDRPLLAYLVFAFAVIGVIAVVIGRRRRS
jgi:hypothetical protein